jgi:pyruvate/2-oxoglutarate/acetoin dehydrogenase E1 component
MENKRKISYCQAINEALHQEMSKDSSIFVYGGEPSIFGSNNGLVERFGPDRCFVTPIAEDAMAGVGIGAAMNGLRPIFNHIRVDFALITLNQMVNMASTISYGSGGKLKVPLTMRAAIGRGWGQGYQHSKSMQSLFAHIPGLKVIMPTTPYDAKGLIISAIRDDNPVISLEHRWLYWQEDHVPEESYTIPIGKGNILRKGRDLTIVATSWMNVEAFKAAEILSAKQGVDVEIVDPRTIAPLDEDIIVGSVDKTGHCIVADNDWAFCGFSAEVAALVSEKCFGRLDSPVQRIGFAHTPCPTVRSLENEFYPNAVNIIRMVEDKLDLPETDLSGEEFYSHENKFFGPF